MLFDIKNPKGFSLIEGMIVMAIAILGAIGGYVVLASARGTLAGNKELVEAQQEARNIVERIAREIRETTPDKIWISSSSEGGSDSITFYTPRDSNRRFTINDEGEPVWQRSITYELYRGSNELYRHQVHIGPDPGADHTYYFEVVSKNVEGISFSRISAEEAPFNRPQDMIGISIRTFSEQDSIGDVADSYADFHTTVKMRN
jgi:type II secretory pathway pseudopilin PulG